MESTNGAVVNSPRCLIDYLRFECLWSFSADGNQDERTLQLMDLLHLDLSYSTDEYQSGSKFRFKQKICLDENVYLYFKPVEKKLGVDDYFLIDLSGQACKFFLERGGNYLDLFLFFSKNRIDVKRIDLAIDDIDGGIDVETIKDKVRRMEFVSNFRARNKSTGKIGNEEYQVSRDDVGYIDEEPLVRDTSKGWSCTFGSKKSGCTELQIYDKVKERAAHGVEVLVKDWVRFEMRISGRRADLLAKTYIPNSFQTGRFGALCSELLHWLIEFKKHDKLGRQGHNIKRNYSRDVSIWPPYERFINGAAKFKWDPNEKNFENSITRAISWTDRQWASTLKKFIGIGFEKAMNIFANATRDNLITHGLNWKEIAQANNYERISTGKSLTNEEMAARMSTQLQEMLDAFCTGEERVDVAKSITNSTYLKSDDHVYCVDETTGEVRFGKYKKARNEK